MGFAHDKYAMNDRRIRANCSRLARFSGISVRLVVPNIPTRRPFRFLPLP